MTGLIFDVLSISVINDKYLPGGEYVRVKTHKKKRLDKKYLKKYGVVYKAPKQIYNFGGKLYIPSSRSKQIAKVIENDKSLRDVLDVLSNKPFFDGLQAKGDVKNG